jgi:hypothetical protein
MVPKLVHLSVGVGSAVSDHGSEHRHVTLFLVILISQPLAAYSPRRYGCDLLALDGRSQGMPLQWTSIGSNKAHDPYNSIIATVYWRDSIWLPPAVASSSLHTHAVKTAHMIEREFGHG